MADDLGVGEPSYTSPGRLHTPHLDTLASEGMRFTAAYAGYTVCAPSRATLFSLCLLRISSLGSTFTAYKSPVRFF